jgi:hypothetical protein
MGDVFAAFQRAPPSSSKSDCSTGPHAVGGPPHLPAFSPPHSEGYILSPASSPILLADLSLLQGFSLLSSQFPCSMFSHTASFLGAYSICMHHASMFCVCPPPTLFPTAFPSCVFPFSLFICTPMCYLFGGLLVSCYFLSSLEGSPRGVLLLRFRTSLCFSVSQGWINFFSLPDGLRHLFGDHNPVYFCLVLNKTTAATSRVLFLFKQCLFHSPPSRPSACLALVRTSTKGLPLQLIAVSSG